MWELWWVEELVMLKAGKKVIDLVVHWVVRKDARKVHSMGHC